MSSLRAWALRLSGLFDKQRKDRELADELETNLQLHIDDNLRRGMSPAEARRDALLKLGGVEQTKGKYRERRGIPFLESLLQDIRFALRTLAKSPGFTAATILTLALGIGANTAIFSLWNGVLHSSLPGVHKPEQLVMLSDPDNVGMWLGRLTYSSDGDRPWLTYAEFEQLRDHADNFSSLMASQSSLDTWQVRFDGGDWEKVRGRLVSGGFFQVLGVNPVLGRVFTPDEDRAESPYVVISYSYWQQRFGGSVGVLGKTLSLRKAALTIIGVTPRNFVGETNGQNPDVWIPLRMQPSVVPGRDWLHDAPPQKVMWLNVFGRLKDGVTQAQAGAQANTIFRSGLESFYGSVTSEDRRREDLDQRLRIRSGMRGASETRSEFSNSLTTLLAAVGVLLLIACANLANLLLARGSARKTEIALRSSLGASRGRLNRQLVTESLVLAVMGGLAGLAAAYFLFGSLVQMVAESDRNFDMSFSLDPLTLLFALVVVLSTALLFGVLPARQITNAYVGSNLKEQSRSTTGSLGQMRWSRILVSVQLALCLPLLVGAGLLVRTIYNLQRIDLGYPPERVLLVRVDFTEEANDVTRHDALLHELLGQFQQIPGVRTASFSYLGVFSGGNTITGIEVEGYLPKEESDRHSAVDEVGPGYFSTLGVPIVQGRDILGSDRGDTPKICVINEVFAKRFFEGRNPIGMHITSSDDLKRTTYEVVGVAKNARTQDLRDDIAPRYFVAAEQFPSSPADSPTFLIRTISESAPVMAAVPQLVRNVDTALLILRATSIEEQMAPLTAQDRATGQLASVFGCVALALAAIGLYGVLSYGVARRTGELAVRIALGAQPGRVIFMIIRETVGLVIAGLIPGAALAYAASRLINSRLYGVAPQDPLTLALATGLLLLVAITAAYLPAWRATKVDPMVALRYE